VNRAFYIIAVPAFIVSFLWMYYGWGLKLAIPVVGGELAIAIWGVIYLRRKAAQSHASGASAGGQARHGEQASNR
jgi:hypothetical protein